MEYREPCLHGNGFKPEAKEALLKEMKQLRGLGPAKTARYFKDNSNQKTKVKPDNIRAQTIKSTTIVHKTFITKVDILESVDYESEKGVKSVVTASIPPRELKSRKLERESDERSPSGEAVSKLKLKEISIMMITRCKNSAYWKNPTSRTLEEIT